MHPNATDVAVHSPMFCWHMYARRRAEEKKFRDVSPTDTARKRGVRRKSERDENKIRHEWRERERKKEKRGRGNRRKVENEESDEEER